METKSKAAPLGEGGQGQGDELDAAQEEGQVVDPVHRVVAAEAQEHDFEKLQTVDEQGGHSQDPVLLSLGPPTVPAAQDHGQNDRSRDENRNEAQMLPGQIALRFPGISAEPKKLFHRILRNRMRFPTARSARGIRRRPGGRRETSHP